MKTAFPVVLWRALLLVNLAVTLALFCRPLLSPQFSWGAASAAASAHGFPEATLEDMIMHFRQQDAVVVDARPPEVYRVAHIPGAINIPAGTQPPRYYKDRLQAATQIVIYCDGPSCGAAEMLAEALLAQGISRSRVFEKGFAAWQEAGMPVGRTP